MRSLSEILNEIGMEVVFSGKEPLLPPRDSKRDRRWDGVIPFDVVLGEERYIEVKPKRMFRRNHPYFRARSEYYLPAETTDYTRPFGWQDPISQDAKVRYRPTDRVSEAEAPGDGAPRISDERVSVTPCDKAGAD